MSQFSQSIPGLGWAKLPASFQLGARTLAIPNTVHKNARLKLAEEFSKKDVTAGIALLEGGKEQNVYDSDTEVLFRQNSWFNYLFGVKEPGFYGAVSLPTGKATLFMPRLHEDYKIWCGTIHPPEYFLEIYGVDEVFYVDQLHEWLKTGIAAQPESKLHLLYGLNTDSGSYSQPATFEGIEEFNVDTSVFHYALSVARVTKSEREIEVMRYCAYVASNAHVEVMRTAKSGMMEYELEAKFLYEIYKNGGCRRCAYTSICACGPNASVLHYGHAAAPNDRQLKATDIALMDMGAEYHGYVSDITCSFPVGGTFSTDQKSIFEAVQAAQIAVLEAIKPGVSWVYCHRQAERAILKALLELGVLRNPGEISDTEELMDRMVELNIGAVFFPHGLGHLIGCDTHDVGGYLFDSPERPTQPGVSKLRTARVLEAGMCLTNEPGCYFIDILLDRALANPEQAQYFDEEVLSRFRGCGGVRLEDVVLVVEGGVENLTLCPRTVAEVESVMAGGKWPPSVDEAPEFRRRWSTLAEGGTMTDISLA